MFDFISKLLHLVCDYHAHVTFSFIKEHVSNDDYSKLIAGKVEIGLSEDGIVSIIRS